MTEAAVTFTRTEGGTVTTPAPPLSVEPIVATDATEHAVEQYLPREKRERRGIALCLSGGGFRAALFHFGALRRLNELGILARLDTITSVSGGSITTAHLATRVAWPIKDRIRDFEREVAQPLRAFTSRNLRTPAILRRFLPWNWLRSSTGVEALASLYRSRLTALTLSKLPERPRFVLCATDMAFGVNWIFERTRLGDYQAGYADVMRHDWPLARTVAASSCFPPVFNPLPIRLPPADLREGKYPAGRERDALIRGLRLTDGGVYDNMGLEPVWKDHAVVLVSDAGALFKVEPDRNLFRRIRRYAGIAENQAWAIRKRWLISNLTTDVIDGTYWGIGSATTSYDKDATVGYSKPLAREVIARVRTDMDAFSQAEGAILENHGYILADAAIKRHVSALLPAPMPQLTVPHPGWMDETKARAALRDSHRRTILGRW